jgi:hypothetical protein
MTTNANSPATAYEQQPCELCAEGYPQVTEVSWDDPRYKGKDLAAIACTTRGYGHVAPRERCEEIRAFRRFLTRGSLP